MRFNVAVIICALLMAGPICGKERQKRFLRSHLLNPLSDRLLGLGDMARELSEAFSSQAQATVHSMVPHTVQAVNGLTGLGMQLGQQVRDGLQKRMQQAGRETEDEDDDSAEVSTSRPILPPLNPFFGFGLLTPWWQGPNVCEERNEIEEPEKDSNSTGGVFSFSFETTRCVPSQHSYVCTRKRQTNGMSKSVEIRRQCCHGFVRRTDGRPGCSELKMEDLLEEMSSLELQKVVEWVERDQGLKDRLQNENFTLFAPSDQAIADFEDDIDDNEISTLNSDRRHTDTSKVLRRHLVEGFANIESLDDGHLLETLDEDSKIRINKYGGRNEMVTANCVPISGKNHFAKNGILHLTSGVLPQMTQSVGEIIETERAFSKFRKLMEKSPLLEDFKKQDKTWTVFVPSDEAFNKLPASLRRQIESGDGCVETILLQHVVRGTLCSAAVTSKSYVRSLLNNALLLTKDESDKLKVDAAETVGHNSLATNGIVHVIDSVLIPPQAHSIIEALEKEDREDLLELIRLADMTEELEGSTNFTFLVPSKTALKHLRNETQEQLKDPAFAKKVIRHHLLRSHAPTRSFSDNKKLTTANGHEVHLKLQELFPGIITSATIQCGQVTSPDQETCSGIIHKINKVLLPPKGGIIETLEEMGNHEIVVKLIKKTSLERTLAESGPFTFLAPSDEAFERMGDAALAHLLENSSIAEDMLKLHVLPEVLCCSGVSPPSPFHRMYARTLDGTALPTYRGLSAERVRFGRARVNECDIPTTNGLIHSVNRVILPEKPTLRSHLFTIF